MAEKKRDEAPPPPSEIPENVKATGSTDELDGVPIREAEVGGEGVGDVVKEKDEGDAEEREAA